MLKTDTLLYGEGGTGKSSSIISILKMVEEFPDIQIRWLMSESNAILGMESGLALHKIVPKPGQLTYMVAQPTLKDTVSSKQIAADYKLNFQTNSNKEALSVNVSSAERSKRSAFYKVLISMAEFKGIDYATKEVVNHGDYLKWNENVVFVIDSLSSCVDYLLAEVKANRIAVVQTDYMHVQNNLMNLVIVPLTQTAKCNVILIGHPVLGEDPNVVQPEKQEDKIRKLYVRTFGQALNGVLPSKFSNTIYSYVVNNRFYWAGEKAGIFTSPRSIPRKDRLEPDFSKYKFFK